QNAMALLFLSILYVNPLSLCDIAPQRWRDRQKFPTRGMRLTDAAEQIGTIASLHRRKQLQPITDPTHQRNGF
ncbi:hypothetical protein, partial [Thermoleptolyngbya sp. C42_A2020_037]|uniref:hypothetical protein n=1 Tax=Thermoleptolyngbya sp. C42_A2020_037 TaxID=2747799 RepID=UPI0025EC3DA9